MKTLTKSKEWAFNSLNVPFVVSREMAKVVKVQLGKPGDVLEIRKDNRYKDGNIKIVDSVVRGNAKTVLPTRFSAPKPKKSKLDGGR